MIGKRKRGRPVGPSDATLRNMQNIVTFIGYYHKTKGFAPTLSEIAVGIGKRPTDFGNVQPLIQRLIEAGFLVNAGSHQGRSLAVAKKLPRRYFYKSPKEE